MTHKEKNLAKRGEKKAGGVEYIATQKREAVRSQ